MPNNMALYNRIPVKFDVTAVLTKPGREGAQQS